MLDHSLESEAHITSVDVILHLLVSSNPHIEVILIRAIHANQGHGTPSRIMLLSNIELKTRHPVYPFGVIVCSIQFSNKRTTSLTLKGSRVCYGDRSLASSELKYHFRRMCWITPHRRHAVHAVHAPQKITIHSTRAESLNTAYMQLIATALVPACMSPHRLG